VVVVYVFLYQVIVVLHWGQAVLAAGSIKEKVEEIVFIFIFLHVAFRYVIKKLLKLTLEPMVGWK